MQPDNTSVKELLKLIEDYLDFVQRITDIDIYKSLNKETDKVINNLQRIKFKYGLK